MLEHLKELLAHRELLWMWTRRDIKVRYKQSILGGAWAILQPLSLMVMFSVIFTYVIEMVSVGSPYPIFVYTALMPWTFFASSITLAVSSLIGNINLLTKIYFPREILPLAIIAAGFVDFLVASLVFVGLTVVYRVSPTVTWLWFPLLLGIQILLTAGVALLTSAIVVFYRDVRFVVPLGMQLWMYATPIIYPVSMVPERLRNLYMLNPMAGLIDGYRRALLLGENPSMQYVASSAFISITVLLIAYWYFKRVEWQFADII